MTKTTRALSGASKDAFFQDVIAREADVPRDARDRLVGRLQRSVSQVRVRVQDAGAQADGDAEARSDHVGRDAFDPFSPNVLVVVRREGASTALQMLQTIGSVQNLKLLAREQQLSISESLTSAAEIAKAIVEAAERRIANMRAAAR